MVITTATSIRYGNYKSLFNKVKELDEIIEPNIQTICELVNVPKDIRIHFRPIPNKGLIGQYVSSNFCVEIDPRKGKLDELLATVCHELVHAEQYYEERLTSDHKYFYWNGERFKSTFDNDTYLNFPWEIEAYNRQYILYDAAFKDTFLSKKNNKKRLKRTTI
jgi:hypothetical protein